ncbi:hypothetical protein Bra5_CH02416 [Rhizobium phaseoli Brasil 5]|nr:hypothetical protein Bra5_CH02416 [Rhizobium phaseoli Brasil 5]
MIHCRLRARLFLEFPPYINRIRATVWKWGIGEVFVRGQTISRGRVGSGASGLGQASALR